MNKTQVDISELIDDSDVIGQRIPVSATPSKIADKEAQDAEDRDLLNQLLGQAQMAEAFGKFSQTVWSSKLAFVKENRLYQSLKGKITPNGLELNGTWVEFCSLLGISDEKANQDIANLKTFGEEALESMSRMGIGYREMRQYRKLPADQQQALIEVAKEGDKESLMELAEELIAKQVKEKEALKADLEISRQNVAEKKEQVSQLQEANEELNNKLKHRIYHETPDQTEAELRKETNLIAHEIETFVSVRLKEAFAALAIHADEHNLPQDDFMAGLLCQIDRRVLQLREEFSLESAPTGTDRPSWLEVDENTLLGQQPVTE
ncbi:hypothetical protein EX227_22400 [Providencia rettgeri]|uniref:hypothetical protein n=3 Tax=Providencia rettgeri TaxID=587 RepID=UPI00103E785E|nr:hypothetical protein [Providencia rettgeri]MBX6950840.1 hypothetical protein [Providencia rettgeri]MBX6960642.1 hypothetical protein [Providencia rettgeri]MBX6983673.1 hypothetical protein [Providencia rettgeri]MBX7008123.1 hypothetical protein [Providencia rettgeri]MBX7034714.1 hypothetical protein [Providencia rettgeri]